MTDLFNRILLVLGMTAALSGCAGLITGAPPETFSLSDPPAAASGPQRNVQILVAEPEALELLDSNQIVIRTSAAAVQYLADSRWNDRLTNVVQAKLVQGFENTGRVRGVGIPGQGLAIDFQIVTTIRTFEVVAFGAAPQSVVEISARVLDDRTGNVRATRVFRATAPLVGTENEDYIAALDAAFGRVSAELVAWALSSI